jgi:hypothetical protein
MKTKVQDVFCLIFCGMLNCINSISRISNIIHSNLEVELIVTPFSPFSDVNDFCDANR